MKYCTNCGNQLVDEAVICPKCGCSADNPNNTSENVEVKAPTVNKPAKQALTPLSIVGFVFAFILPLVGLICSILAYKDAVNDENKRCKTFSKAGLIIAAVMLGLNILCEILNIVFQSLGIGHFNRWNLWFHLLF